MRRDARPIPRRGSNRWRRPVSGGRDAVVPSCSSVVGRSPTGGIVKAAALALALFVGGAVVPAAAAAPSAAASAPNVALGHGGNRPVESRCARVAPRRHAHVRGRAAGPRAHRQYQRHVETDARADALGLAPGTSRGCSVSRSHPTARSSTSTTPTANGDIHVVEYTMAGDVANVGVASRVAGDRAPRRMRITTAVRSSSVPTATSTSATGDGGGGGDPDGNGQNLNSLLGKILRINPAPAGGKQYSVPSDNPFVGQAGARGRDLDVRAAQPVAVLVRSRDRTSMWIGDVGQALYEEVDYTPAGQQAARTGVGTSARDSIRTTAAPSPPAADPLLEVSHTPTAPVRSSAVTCTAALRSTTSPARTCSATAAGRAARRDAERRAPDEPARPRLRTSSDLSTFGEDPSG